MSASSAGVPPRQSARAPCKHDQRGVYGASISNAWTYPCYFCILWHASGAKCGNNAGNPKLCVSGGGTVGGCMWEAHTRARGQPAFPYSLFTLRKARSLL